VKSHLNVYGDKVNLTTKIYPLIAL
jgi:hypothetical protein